jgi:hypothetical protein
VIITLAHVGDGKIVTSAFYEKCTDLTSLLVINTYEKGVPWDSVMSGDDYLKVEYWDHDNMSQVWVYAEDDFEKGVLDRTRYELLCKDQLQFLFIDVSLVGG